MSANVTVVPEAHGRKYERDIDVLLAEEFAVSPKFAAWCVGQTRKFKGSQASVTDVFISKSDNLGESDLVVVLERDDRSKFALYIEDKIDAQLQPRQEERYRLRARRGVQKGLYEDFEVLLCAPDIYHVNRSEAELFDSFISYESIGEFFRSCDPDDIRMIYRARFIESSIPLSATAWKREDDEITNAYWDAAYEMAHQEFLELEMKPLTVTKGQTWINFRPSDMPTSPQRIYVSFKGAQGQMDLTFSDTRNYLFAPRVRPVLEEGMDVIQTAKSCAIRLRVDPCNVCEPDDEAKRTLRSAFAACVRLINFYRKHREVLDLATAESQPLGQ